MTNTRGLRIVKIVQLFDTYHKAVFAMANVNEDALNLLSSKVIEELRQILQAEFDAGVDTTIKELEKQLKNGSYL